MVHISYRPHAFGVFSPTVCVVETLLPLHQPKTSNCASLPGQPAPADVPRISS